MSAADWQPIATAPKGTVVNGAPKGEYFLGYCPDESLGDPKACIVVCWWEPFLDGGRWQGEGDYELRPTHWLPLPEPPASEVSA